MDGDSDDRLYEVLLRRTVGDSSEATAEELTEALRAAFPHAVDASGPVHTLAGGGGDSTRYLSGTRRVVVKRPPGPSADAGARGAAGEEEAAALLGLLRAYARYAERTAAEVGALGSGGDDMDGAGRLDSGSEDGSGSDELGATVVLAGARGASGPRCSSSGGAATRDDGGACRRRQLLDRLCECAAAVGAFLSAALFPADASPGTPSPAVLRVRAALLLFVRQQLSRQLLAALSVARAPLGSRRSTPRVSTTVSSSPRQRDEDADDADEGGARRQSVARAMLPHWLWVFVLCGLADDAAAGSSEPAVALLALAEGLTRDYVTRQCQKGYVDALVSRSVFGSHAYTGPAARTPDGPSRPFLSGRARRLADLFPEQGDGRRQSGAHERGGDWDDAADGLLLHSGTSSVGRPLAEAAAFGTAATAAPGPGPAPTDMTPLRSVLLMSGRLGQSADGLGGLTARGLALDPAFGALASVTPPASGRVERGGGSGLHARQQARLARAEKELAAAKKALQFGVKLGSLYGTQDINGLLPLLPATRGPEVGPSSVLSPGALPERGGGAGTPIFAGLEDDAYDRSAHWRRHRPHGRVLHSPDGVGSTLSDDHPLLRPPFVFAAAASHFAQRPRQSRLIAAMRGAVRAYLQRRGSAAAPLASDDTSTEVVLLLALTVLGHSLGCEQPLSPPAAAAGLALHLRAAAVPATLASAALVAVVRQNVHLAETFVAVLVQLVASSASSVPPAAPPLPLLRDARLPNEEPPAAVYARVWLAHFEQVADTTKHLFRTGHGAPRTLESVVWYLASLVSYFGALCRRLLPRPPTTAAALPARPSPAAAAALQELVLLPADRVAPALVDFMEALVVSIGEGDDNDAPADDETGGGVGGTFRYAVEETSPTSPTFHGRSDSARGGDSMALLEAGVEGGGDAAGPAGKRLPTSVLCVHYYLAFVDTLLEAAVAAGAKPLFLTSLLLGLRRCGHSPYTCDRSSLAMTGSPVLPPPPTRSGAGDSPSGDAGAEPLGLLQSYLDDYCNVVIQRELAGSPQERGGGVVVVMETHGRGSTEGRPSGDVWSDRLGSARDAAAGAEEKDAEAAEDGAVPPLQWPCDHVSAKDHFTRVSQHVLLVAEYCAEADGAAAGRTDNHRRAAPQRLLVSGLTSLLDTAGGACTQLLSLPYSAPHTRVVYSPTSLAMSPTHAAASTVSSTLWRLQHEDGLRLRIWMLKLLSTAALPFDQDHQLSCARALRREAAVPPDYRDALCGALTATDSALPHQFSTTYVRLIFLRLVQSFYSSSATASSGALERSACGSERALDASGGAEAAAQRAEALWSTYLVQLLRALRTLCEHHLEAHRSALKLSVPAVLARLLQTIEVAAASPGATDDASASDSPRDVRRGSDPGTQRSPAVTPMPKNFVDFEDFSGSDGGSEAGGGGDSDEAADGAGATSAETPANGDEDVGEGDQASADAAPPELGLPRLPALSFAGLGPALYYASSGDTGAAQEEALISQGYNHPGGDGLHGDGDGLPAETPGTAASTDQDSFAHPPDADADADTAAAADAGPLPPPVVVPRLSMGSLGPPLYFVSNGETGAGREDDFLPTVTAPPTVNSTAPSEGAASPAEALYTDNNTGVGGDEEEEEEEEEGLGADGDGDDDAAAAAAAVPSFLPPLPAPPAPAFVLPKLSFANLAPPLYYTSSGDTGLFGEVPDPAKVAQSSPDVSAAPVPSAAAASDRDPPKEEEKTAAVAPAAAARLRDKASARSGHRTDRSSIASSRRDPTDAGSLSASSSAAAVAARGRQELLVSLPEPLRLVSLTIKSTSPRRAEDEAVAAALGGKSSSSPCMPPTLQRVPAATCAELVLCLVTLILHRQSGAVQHAFTVSALTQRRVAPFASRRPLGFVDRSTAARDERSRPNYVFRLDLGAPATHGAAAFHVVKSIYTFLLQEDNRAVCRELRAFLAAHYEERQLEYLRCLCAKSSTNAAAPGEPTATAAATVESPLSAGLFVLLRFLLPRRRWLRDFDVLRRLGSGGFGSVILATYNGARGGGGGGARGAVSAAEEEAERAALTHHGRLAIKLMPLRLQGSETGSLPMCHMEALAMRRLHGHPHVSELLSFGCTAEEYAIVMPQYVGGCVQQWRLEQYPPGYAALSIATGDDGPTLTSVCADMFLQLLSAVAHTHRHRLRHGDVKAANLFIDGVDHVARGAASACAGEGSSSGAASQWASPSSGRGGGDGDGAPTRTVPRQIRLGDFGSCDAVEDEDVAALISDVEGGEGRFLAGRWGSGHGTEAIQPPELIRPQRRYAILRGVLEAHHHATPRRASAAADVGAAQLHQARASAGSAALYATLRQIELSADIWACGCTLYEMLTGRMLFGEARLGRLLVLAGSGAGEAPAVLDEWDRQDLEDAVGPSVLRFLSALLAVDPLQRPTAEEALAAWQHIRVHDL